MKAYPWIAAAAQSAAPERARHGFNQLEATALQPPLTALANEHARVLAALFSGSQAMSVLLLKHPDWVHSVLSPNHLAFPRQAMGLRREVSALLQSGQAAKDRNETFAKLRQFKQREMLRIAARDLGRFGDTAQIFQEISDVADVCLSATLQLCLQQLTERIGQPFHLDPDGQWQPTQFAVLGLGKLGGQELNYSSDVDVMFVYSEEGHVFKTAPRKNAATERALTNHQFFKRLAEAFIAEVSRSSSDGTLFRIDLRLRPEGDTGPLVRSLASYENFYAQWGQTWERMMLIKARGVAGDGALAAEFLEMVQSFRYPRSLGEGALREIASMKTRIENEVVRTGEMDRNVKLGRGGIREVEFVVQSAQLLHAGRIPFLQGAQTLPLLEKLAQYKLLAGAEARDLATAYCYLRDVEHRVQMEDNRQTHTIPADAESRARLAALMGHATLKDFDQALRKHTDRVRQIYDKFVKAEAAEAPSLTPSQFRGAEAEWKRLLANHGFQAPEKSFRLLNEFANGPGYVHVSQRTTELAMQLIPKFLALCAPVPSSGFRVSGLGAAGAGSNSKLETRNPKPGTAGRVPGSEFRVSGLGGGGAGRNSKLETRNPKRLSDPDRVLARLDRFITAYGARSVLFETWTANPQIFELLLLLFDRSEFLAEIAIRTPDLVDELVLSRRLGRSKNAGEILTDLQHGSGDADQSLWLRRYHQTEFMRIGLRSILGLADSEQNLAELTALADACLQYALEVALRRHRLATPPLVIVGLGKLGGTELTYGSDLDILFVADDHARKTLPKLQKLAVEVIGLLSTQTAHGMVFVTDARLRPDGEKGLLVNTLAAYEEYYRQRAQLWEIQALTRTRPIAGDSELGRKFQQIASRLTNFQRPSLPLAAYAPDWKRQIAHMRQRIEKKRTPPGQDALAFKTGRGGLIDAEFIAQSNCLEHGWQEANTLRVLERVRDEKILAPADAEKLLESYRQLRRLESILRRWSFEGEVMLPVEAAPYLRVAIRCGFASSEAFREAVARWRQAVREVYDKVFSV